MQYLKGLNTLRFFAALLVLIGHARVDLEGLGISHTNILFTHKGADAVQFFFLLSGFLLTYLSLTAVEKYGKFNIKRFYINRILRIWPLYYLCVCMGFIALGFILPHVLHIAFLGFSVKEGLPYFLLFLPNYIVSLHPVSNVGALYALWSIGVEEQFYLFFPLLVMLIVKSKRPVMWLLCISIIYSAFYYLNLYSFFHFNPATQIFITTLKFHFMFIGCLFAVLYKKKPALVQKLLPDKKITQAILLLLIAVIVFDDLPIRYATWGIMSAIVYGCFIINTFSATKQIISLENPWLSYLGNISYGIYMFHPYILCASLCYTKITYHKKCCHCISTHILCNNVLHNRACCAFIV